MKILLSDYVDDLRAAGFAPVTVPSYTDSRGQGVVVRNGEGWPIIRLPSPDGWRDELTYWYSTARLTLRPCRACMAPAGVMILTVSPTYALDITSEAQALSIAHAWKLSRPPRVGRIVRCPFGRTLNKRVTVGHLHPQCLLERMNRRGWAIVAAEGLHSDAARLSERPAAITSDVTFSPVERPARPETTVSTWIPWWMPHETQSVLVNMQTARPMQPASKETVEQRKRSARPVADRIIQTMPK